MYVCMYVHVYLSLSLNGTGKGRGKAMGKGKGSSRTTMLPVVFVRPPTRFPAVDVTVFAAAVAELSLFLVVSRGFVMFISLLCFFLFLK